MKNLYEMRVTDTVGKKFNLVPLHGSDERNVSILTKHLISDEGIKILEKYGVFSTEALSWREIEFKEFRLSVKIHHNESIKPLDLLSDFSQLF